jgi:hypothetical protein
MPVGHGGTEVPSEHLIPGKNEPSEGGTSVPPNVLDITSGTDIFNLSVT